MIGYVRGLLPVRRDERGIVLLLYTLLTLMVAADWVGKVGTNAVFVKRVGVAYLPVMYIVTPLVMLVASTFIFGLVDRMRRRDLFLWYIAGATVLSIATQAAMSLGGPDYWWGYIFAHVVKETVYLIFWVYAGNLFDAEQSKRVFPLFAGALLVGKIGGGVASTALGDILHSENFMAVQAVGFAICLVIVLIYRKHLPEGEGAVDVTRHRPQGLRAGIRGSLDGYKAVASDGLLRRFGVNIFFWYFLMQIANYLYSAGLDAATAGATLQGSEDAYAQVYASVYTSGSIVALLLQTFVTGALIRRVGVSAVLFFFPLWYVATYGLVAWPAIGITFLTGILLQMGERVIVPALHLPATQVVYSQVAAELRPRARAFFSGGVNALGNVGAALVVIAGVTTGAIEAVLVFGAACSVVFVGNTMLVRGALGRRIIENLRSEDPELRRNAAQMLHGEGRAVRTEHLSDVLRDASADIEVGVRLALTRRGALAAAAEANAE